MNEIAYKPNNKKPIPQAQNGIEGTMGGLTDKGFNYNGAWGGTMAMGGSLPGSVGFTYARTQGSAPANGKYTKKTKASAQNGEEMKYYQEGLDWKPKNISRDGSVIEDDMGQWAHPGEITRIPSNQITMQGVDYPVLGISDTGDTQMMYPDQDYSYDGESVTEYPMMQGGGKVSLRSLMNNDDLKAKSDATKVVPQKTMTAEQAAKLKAKKDTEELQRRKQAIANSKEAKGKPLSVQNLADESGAIGDKLRIFPNDPDSFIDEYLNPGVMIGNMASGIGRIPLNIQEGNYGQAAMSVATPLAVGALAGIGAQSTGQFANNLANPFAGTGDLAKGVLDKRVASSIDNVVQPITPKPWQLQELPGLHLKSTMEGEAISRIVEPKTGLINTEQALAIIGKESGGSDKVAMIRQGLGDNIPKKMDYNDFRKTVQDQLIPLETRINPTGRSEYGLERIGYYDEPPMDRGAITFSNKDKFGRGSSAHGNPEETLGHAHFLRDVETPNVLTVTQIQSDAFQGTHRNMPKNIDEAVQKVNKLKEEGKEIKSLFSDGKETSNSVLANYEKYLQLDEATAKNFTQKQLLDKNHQERYLQELVDYAGKRGDINKVRVPTSETAAKVQGYRPATNSNQVIEEYNKVLNTPEYDRMMADLSEIDKVKLQKVLKGEIKGNIYDSEYETILKKYSEQPKTIKKLFSKEPTIVTDSKGNTWYEFDIPKKFKEGKGEIKAFGLSPFALPTALGLGAASQIEQKKNGGWLNKYN